MVVVVVVMMMKNIKRAWESIKENVKASATGILGYCELKQHKPCFDEECSKLLDQGNRPNGSGCRI